MTANRRLVTEMCGGEPYKFYPLGKYIVAAPGVCGGRPTFKYTRIEVAFVLALLGQDRTASDLVKSYRGRISLAGIEEALALAGKALVRQTPRRAVRT